MNGEQIDICVGILAGGSSRRMGRDKALLTIEGEETMLERAVGTALRTGCVVAVSGREAPDGWANPQVDFIPDRIPCRGPLHGIIRLLERYGLPVLAIGCDMPRLTPEALGWLITRFRRLNQWTGGDRVDEGVATEGAIVEEAAVEGVVEEAAVEGVVEEVAVEGVAVTDGAGVIQPLFSMYTPAILSRPDIGSVDGSASDLPSARIVIETGRFERIVIPKDLEAVLWSVDTPDDFELLRRGSTSPWTSPSI